jgi:CheY-like chemotaxis protein
MHAHADSRTTVLIVSDDPTAAALLGGLVETLGYRPEFATALTSSGSFRQKRPQACLVDCQSDSCDEPSIARAIMRGFPGGADRSAPDAGLRARDCRAPRR